MNCPNCHCPRGEPLTVAVNSLVTRCHHAFHAVATAEVPPLNEPLHPQSPVTPDDFAQQKPAQDATAHVWCPVNGMGGCAHAGECVGVVCLAHDRKERPKDFPYTTPAMACPTCNDAPGAAPFCSNGYHLAPIQPPYTTPVPTLHDGSTGWVYCEACDAPQPVAGHECAACRFGHRHMSAELAAACAHDGIPDEHLRWRQAEFRAELAESLLCAIAFDDARLVIDIRHGEGCDPGEPDRDCLLCKVQREHVRRR